MQPRGLRDYLRQKGDSMRAAAQQKPEGRDWSEEVSATCVSDDLTGVRKLRIRDWQLVGDSGPSFGGWSLGPSSPELLCGVISTCLTHTYEIGAARMEIPVDRIEVRVGAGNNDARFLEIETDDPALPFDITARIRVDAPDADPAALSRLHQYAAERCPLTQLIRTANAVTLVVES